MKKKFLAIYALAGALVASPVFTSCVDDKESDSVTAVRNAKAEQLKALAALSNAQAEAQKIQAEAIAALNNAKAEYEKNQTEEAKQKFAAQLEMIKAQAEQEMWYAKWQAADYEQKFNDLANNRIKALYGDYKIAVNDLNTLLSNQLEKQNTLAQLKAGLITTEEYASIINAGYDKEIANFEFEISLYEKYEGADRDKLKQDKTIAERDANKLHEPLGELQNKKNEAERAYDAKYADNNYFNISSTSPFATLKAAEFIRNKGGWDHVTQKSQVLAGDMSIQVVALDAEWAAIKKTEYENSIASYKRELGEPATETTEASGYYREIENMKKDIESQQNQIKEWQTQLEENPEATWLQDNIDFANNRIADLQENIKRHETVSIPSKKLDIKNKEEELKEFEAAVKSFDAEGEDWKAYQAAIAEQTKLAEAVVAAQKAHDKAYDAWEAKNAEVEALGNLYDSAFDVEDRILNLKKQIVLRKELKQNQLNNVSNKEASIAQAEEQLKTYETQITAQKAIIANIEEAIKAAIGETEA